MASYPEIRLEEQVITPPVVVTLAKVQEVREVPGEKVIVVFSIIDNQPIELEVLNEANYFPDWSDETVIDAIKTYVNNLSV